MKNPARLSMALSGLGLCACTLLAGCGSHGHPSAAAMPVPEHELPMSMKVVGRSWRIVATDRDRERLRTWREAWVEALAKIHTAGRDADIADPLFEPDRALDGGAPPPGRYHCHVFKLGANGSAMKEFTSYPPEACLVADEGGITSLVKLEGPQRPIGLFFPESSSRQIFLGTMTYGDESKPMDYGRDDGRDLAGYVEKVGAQRWRLVFPYPKFESLVDVIELVPDGAPVKP